MDQSKCNVENTHKCKIAFLITNRWRKKWQKDNLECSILRLSPFDSTVNEVVVVVVGYGEIFFGETLIRNLHQQQTERIEQLQK